MTAVQDAIDNTATTAQVVEWTQNHLTDAAQFLQHAVDAEAELVSPHDDEARVIECLEGALRWIDSAGQNVRNRLRYYRDRATHRELTNGLVEYLTELPVGTVTNSVELKRLVDTLLDEQISDEVQHAEARAGWDPNP